MHRGIGRSAPPLRHFCYTPTNEAPMTVSRHESLSLRTVPAGALVNVGQAVAAYIRDSRPILARTTLQRRRWTLESFAQHTGPIPVRAITARHARTWLEARAAALGTQRTYLSDLRAFTKWCVRRGWLRDDPTREIRIGRPAELAPRELDRASTDALFDRLPDTRARLIVSLMLHEGLRCIEVVRLQDGDVDQVQRTLIVTGKGGHQRLLPLTEATGAAILRYRAERGRHAAGVLVASKADPRLGITTNHLSKLVATWLRDAGLKVAAHDGVSAHAYRHTMAGRMLDRGADPRDVQEALGHSSLGSTWRYTKRRRRMDRLREYMDPPNDAA